jgi:hypothetical protein
MLRDSMAWLRTVSAIAQAELKKLAEEINRRP